MAENESKGIENIETVSRVLGLEDFEGGCYDALTEEVLTDMYQSLFDFLSHHDAASALTEWKARFMTARMPVPPDGQANFDTLGFTVLVGANRSEDLRKGVEQILWRGPNHTTSDGIARYSVGLHRPGQVNLEKVDEAA